MNAMLSRCCTLLFIAATCSTHASAQYRDPDQDRSCAQKFGRSQASLTCHMTSARYFIGGDCQIVASCRTDNGGSKSSAYHGPHDRVVNLCNRNGQLALGCPPL